jgi:hypothetical protein
MGSTVIERVAWKVISFEDFEMDSGVKDLFANLYLSSSFLISEDISESWDLSSRLGVHPDHHSGKDFR